MILVTRPQPEADATANALRERGFDVLIEPMLTVVPLDGKMPADVDVALFTSGNGVRHVPETCVQQQPRVLTVGEKTAQLARDRGFTHIEAADGDVEGLYALCKRRLKPTDHVVHFAGMFSYGSLAERLKSKGFQVDEVLVYEARAAPCLSPQVMNQMKQGVITSALFFSPRTARVFMENAGKSSLIPYLTGLKAYCLSPAVAETLPQDVWKSVIVANQPQQEDLLNRIYEQVQVNK